MQKTRVSNKINIWKRVEGYLMAARGRGIIFFSYIVTDKLSMVQKIILHHIQVSNSN